MSRIALHDLLMRELPDGVMNYGAHVLRVEKREGGGVNIQFETGEVEEADVVIAADGLYSVGSFASNLSGVKANASAQKIRRSYFPDEKITYRGRVSYRQNVPVELVQHIKGLPGDTSSYRRDNEFVFLSRLGMY
jgi:salicylate hydroxylase